MPHLTDVYDMIVGGIDAKQRWKKNDVNQFKDDLELEMRMNPGGQPSEGMLQRYYKLYPDQRPGQQQEQQTRGQPAQQGAIPGFPSAPGQQTQLSSSNLGQQAGGQAQQQQDIKPGTLYRPQQRPMYPQEGVAAFDVQTGKPGPITYYPEHTKVIPTNANPKGITWMVDPTGKNKPVQTFEGDPRAQQLADAGYIPMLYDVQKTKQAQEEKKESNLAAYHQAKLAQGENKPDTAQQHKEAIEGLEKKRALGETLTPDEDAILKAYYKVNPKPMGSEAPAFEEMKPEQQKLAMMRKDQLLKGLIPYPDRYLLARQPDWNTAIQLAQQDDPNFSAATYPTRLKARISFTSGADSKNITSLNTAIGHLATLKEKMDALDNTNWSRWYNSLGNAINEQFGSLNPTVSKAVTGFGVAATALANELSTAFKGTSGTNQEVTEWRKSLNSSATDAQMHEAADTAVKLLGSRIEFLRDKYKEAMGTTEDLQILRGGARKTLEKMIGKDAVDAMDPPKAEKEVQGGGQGAAGADVSTRAAQVLQGKPEGEYKDKATGKTIKWDGSKVIE